MLNVEELNTNGLLRHNLPPPHALLKCETVLDIGAGIRPFNWYRPSRHLCVEPYPIYAYKLQEAGYDVRVMTAETALRALRADQILLLDVVEHMERSEAEIVIALAKEAARRQVIIYTPIGFMPQDGDTWELGGDYWQLHRSGWTPEDFPGWTIELRSKGFFAIWTREP